MLNTQFFQKRRKDAKRPRRHPFASTDRAFAHAMAAGLLLAAASFPTSPAEAGPPVTIDVTVTGAGGTPIPDATVTVTQVGSQLVDPLAVTGGGTTSANGTASIGRGAAAPAHTDQPLPAGVYQVDVVSGGVQTTTYVYVPEGQTGTPTVDLSTATTVSARGQTYTEATAAAAAAQRTGNQAGYDAAVARVNELVEAREDSIEALERAAEQYRRDNNIPAANLYRVGKLLKRHREAVERGFGDPAAGPPLEKYRDLLQGIQAWRDVLKVMEKGRDDIPSFSYLPWAEADGDGEYAALDRPWRQPDVPDATFHQPTYRVNLQFHHHY